MAEPRAHLGAIQPGDEADGNADRADATPTASLVARTRSHRYGTAAPEARIMATKFPGQEHLFDDDEWGFESTPEEPKPKRTVAGGDPKAFLALVARVPGLRLVPCAEKIPLVKGWNGAEFWRENADITQAIKRWVSEYARPNFAFALGPKCGEDGDIVVEADNQAGEDWCREHLPATAIATLTRHAFWHRHYKVDAPDPDTGLYRGNFIDIFGAKKRHQQEAIAAGYDVVIDAKRQGDTAYLAYIASQRKLASTEIPMGPLVDIKCAGGQVMAPGSVHPTGYVYREVAPWTLDTWRARPVFDRRWFPDTVWAERDRQRMLEAEQHPRVSTDTDPWWTPERRYRRAMDYVRRVGAKSTGEGSSGPAMRIATVLVRGLMLEPPVAREIMHYWGKQICAHQPWSRKELEHKLADAHDKGRMSWGELLRRGPPRDAWLWDAEQRVAEIAKKLRAARFGAADHVSDDDLGGREP